MITRAMHIPDDPKITLKIELFEKYKQYHAAIFTNMHRKACMIKMKWMLIYF